MLRSRFLAGAALPCLLLAVPAGAQIQDGTAPSARTHEAQPDTIPSWTGDTIVVTGMRDRYAEPDSSSVSRTNTPLIQTSQSVQVLNRKLIEEQDRRTLADALVNVSGVIFGAINLPSVGIWAAMGAQMRRFLNKPKALRAFNVAAAVLLVGSLYPIVFGDH